MVCLHDSILALQLPEVLVGCGVALVQVKVDRGHTVLHEALEVEANPVPRQPYMYIMKYESIEVKLVFYNQSQT